MSNPALNEKTLMKLRDVTDTSKMTISGTINRAGLLILITILGAYLGYGQHSPVIMIGSLIVGIALSLIIIFKPHTSPMLAPAYALVEGVLLGSISAVYSVMYPGIVANALILTLSILVLMLSLYRFKIIRVTDRTRSVIVGATMAIAVTYLVNMVMSFFGTSIPMIHQTGTMGIIFSVVVVGVAAFNLLLDFDMIERAESQGAPKYMEWYGGFALLITLVWLYMEILRLLGKVNRK
ncbi:MAG: Bax inhibitor-1/YccA family protein [Bdellovibrionaceae bacterium]|nr:Bax inhibitor-1/YccA family protein [Bdellovibrio sp.]